MTIKTTKRKADDLAIALSEVTVLLEAAEVADENPEQNISPIIIVGGVLRIIELLHMKAEEIRHELEEMEVTQ